MTSAMKPVMRPLATALGALLLAWLAWRCIEWGLVHAVFRPDAQACQAIGHQGACWGVVPEKARSILLGHYPYEAQWRPLSALIVVFTAAVGAFVAGWRRVASIPGFVTMMAALLIMTLLMHGGVAGLPAVPFDQWGGLPLTLWLFAVSLLLSVPIGCGLALGRRASRAWISWPCTTVIEAIRGVPLVTLLFAAAFMLPALFPADTPVPLVWRAMLALTLFSSVYLAEVVRAGLQSVAREQSEAAAILGLSWWQTQRQVVLPQALRAVLPALVGHGIGLLKDSSLVMVIGLHELTGGLSLSLGGDPVWRPFYLEAYLFVGFIYAAMCLSLSRAGKALERRWMKGSY